MVNQSIVDRVQKYLQTLQTYGMTPSFGVVFGSWATGRADEWSDIDLLVVSPRFDVERRRGDIHTLWRIAAEVDSRIEPMPCGEQQWESDTSSAIVEIARREGVRITLPIEGEAVPTRSMTA